MEKRVSFGCEGVARATWLEILLVPKIKQTKRGKEGKQRERERERKNDKRHEHTKMSH